MYNKCLSKSEVKQQLKIDLVTECRIYESQAMTLKLKVMNNEKGKVCGIRMRNKPFKI